MAVVSISSPPSKLQKLAVGLIFISIALPFALWPLAFGNAADAKCLAGSPAAASAPQPAVNVATSSDQGTGKPYAPAAIQCLQWSAIRWYPLLCGVMAMLVLYFITMLAAGNGRPLAIVMGTDGKLSSSQLQLILWTFVLLFSYTMLYMARFTAQMALYGKFGPFPVPPTNVLIAVGLGLVTAVGATKVATLPGSAPAATPPQAAAPAPAARIDLRDLFVNDSGYPDFTRIQMLSWTAVAAALYLGNVLMIAHGFAAWDPSAPASASNTPQFPDIQPALMWLMGLSQATYLGNKLAQKT